MRGFSVFPLLLSCFAFFRPGRVFTIPLPTSVCFSLRAKWCLSLSNCASHLARIHLPVRDKKHVDWVKAYLSIWTELQTCIKQHHTTGLSWSKTVSGRLLPLLPDPSARWTGSTWSGWFSSSLPPPPPAGSSGVCLLSRPSLPRRSCSSPSWAPTTSY